MKMLISFLALSVTFVVLSGCSMMPYRNGATQGTAQQRSLYNTPPWTPRQKNAAGGAIAGLATALVLDTTTKAAIGYTALGALAGYYLTEEPCTYTLHDSRHHKGNNASLYQGTETRRCVIHGTPPRKPSFELPRSHH